MDGRLQGLIEAVRDGDPGRVEQLLVDMPDLANAIDDHGASPLHHAAERNRPDVVSVLLRAGADVSARAPWGHTPLAWAANCGSGEAGRRLEEGGGGPPTLWDASGLGWETIVATALESSPIDDALRHERVERRGDRWVTEGLITDDRELVSDCLYIAGRNGHVAIVERFLAAGADIDFRGYFGGTALHWAAINGHEAAVRFLVDRGADLRLRDTRFDATPAGWAREGGHEALTRFLAEAGA